MAVYGSRHKYKADHLIQVEKRNKKLRDIFIDLKIKNGFTAVEIARKTGLSTTTINSLFTSEQMNFSEKCLSALEKAFGVVIDRESLEIKRGGE